jgi:DNA-binding protein HU-beta
LAKSFEDEQLRKTDKELRWDRESRSWERRVCKPRSARGHPRAKGRSIFEKKELIEAIAEKSDVPKSQAQKVFDAFEEVVTDSLKGGDEVQITGFRKFYVREQKARDGRNPQTGEKMRIPAQRVHTFTAGNSLKESV